jgi:hypothetical protein
VRATPVSETKRSVFFWPPSRPSASRWLRKGAGSRLRPRRFGTSPNAGADTDVERAIRGLIALGPVLRPARDRPDGRGVCTRSDPNESNRARISICRAAASGCRRARLTMNAGGAVIVSDDPYSRHHLQPRAHLLLGLELLGQVAEDVEAIVLSSPIRPTRSTLTSMPPPAQAPAACAPAPVVSGRRARAGRRWTVVVLVAWRVPAAWWVPGAP